MLSLLLPLISQVEHRMSQLSGWMVHGADEPLLLTQQNPGVTEASLDGSRLHAAAVGISLAQLPSMRAITSAKSRR